MVLKKQNQAKQQVKGHRNAKNNTGWTEVDDNSFVLYPKRLKSDSGKLSLCEGETLLQNLVSLEHIEGGKV